MARAVPRESHGVVDPALHDEDWLHHPEGYDRRAAALVENTDGHRGSIHLCTGEPVRLVDEVDIQLIPGCVDGLHHARVRRVVIEPGELRIGTEPPGTNAQSLAKHKWV